MTGFYPKNNALKNMWQSAVVSSSRKMVKTQKPRIKLRPVHAWPSPASNCAISRPLKKRPPGQTVQVALNDALNPNKKFKIINKIGFPTCF